MFWQSLWIGLAIAAPVGPIGLLVIQRTLAHGRAVGLATGLGAAVADAVYGAIGAFGVAALIGALQAARLPLALVGGAFLLWLAWRTWPRRGADAADEASPAAGAVTPAASAAGPPLAGAFAGTFFLTLSNPATILSFIAIFGAMLGGAGTGAGAGAGAAAAGGAAPAAVPSLGGASPWSMVAGVLVGSALWWLLLAGAVGALRHRFDARARAWVARLSALALAAFALWQWAGLAGGSSG